MEAIFINEILKSLGEGNVPKGVFNIAVFVLIWLQLKGLKKEVKNLNSTLATKFSEGENRFTKIEGRLEVLEKQQPLGGLLHGKSV